MTQPRVLDLFSGIGGFSLGLERAGMKTVAFCEKNKDCQFWLNRNWPDTPIHDDIRTLAEIAKGLTADVVCGGFPCQPFSTASAGKRKGVDDDRYLWPSMLAVIKECQPSWVIGENVAGIDGMALDAVVSDLEGIGYEVAPPLEIPACAVGHDHRRSRIWILAYADMRRKHGSAINAETQMLQWRNRIGGRVLPKNGVPSELAAIRAYGNAVVPQIPELIGRAIIGAMNEKASI